MDWTAEQVVAEVAGYDCRLVEVTGGEPLLQSEVYPLMQALLDRGHTVLLETGGHVSLDRVPDGVITVMDVKCPGSGESHRVDWENLKRLRPRDEVKFVIRDREDFEFARRITRQHGLEDRVAPTLFSPVHGVLDPSRLAAWVIEDRLRVRVQLQVHKYIWGATTRGV